MHGEAVARAAVADFGMSRWIDGRHAPVVLTLARCLLTGDLHFTRSGPVQYMTGRCEASAGAGICRVIGGRYASGPSAVSS